MTNRRLAALLMADVAGYSRMVGADEAGALASVKSLKKEVIEAALASHAGRLVKTMGDGFLVEFGSAVKAVECATSIQARLPGWNESRSDSKPLQLRLGVHVGDVVIEDDGDVFGDGVNVAARLQAFGEPGSICLSAEAFRQVEGKLPVIFRDAGEQRFKNIDRPVRVYVWTADQAHPSPSLPLPDKPSIAVLPFANMSGDPEQDYFADGIVEDITTALSRFRNLLVIARNSSFTFKGKAVDAKHIGRELGARYILEGSVRISAERVRITGKLIEAATNAHIWADRFEGKSENVFDLQDQVTAGVVTAIAPKIEAAEVERVRRRPTTSLSAYDHFLKGLFHHHRWTRASNEAALKAYYQAIALDDEFAAAYAYAAASYVQRKSSGWTVDRSQELDEGERLARHSVELAPDDATVLASAALTYGFMLRRLDRAKDLVERALTLNPNYAVAWLVGGWIELWNGEPQLAIYRLKEFKRMSPRDPRMFNVDTSMAFASFFAGDLSAATICAAAALREHPDFHGALRISAIVHAAHGDLAKAQEAVARLCKLGPEQRISNFKEYVGPYSPTNLAKLEDALRRAGLPE